MTKVVFDIIRHGEKNSDCLTPRGVEQVKASALKNLSGPYTQALFSGLNRARQTVEICLASIGHPEIPLRVEVGFSYVTASQEAEKWVGQPIADLKEEGYRDGQNVEFWLKNWAPALVIRGQILATMRLRAQMAIGTAKSERRILVGSHGPTAEAGCLDPANTAALREADIIRYTWEVDPEEATPPLLVSSIVLRAPY
ncbi:MAG: histidine phosphatase family protein [bacterium]|nr:histidine phosphatase family protein [bacterium]